MRREVAGWNRWVWVGMALLLGCGCAVPVQTSPAVAADTRRLEEAVQSLSMKLENLVGRLEVLEKAQRAAVQPRPNASPHNPSPPEKVRSKPQARVGTKPAKRRASASAAVASKPVWPRSRNFVPDAELYICPRLTVSNRPRVGPGRRIRGYRPFVKIGAAVLAVAPQNGACLSSGFGYRRGRFHKGLDYIAKPAPMIHAAGAGTIVEAAFHGDYGWMVVVSHGDGVFTRYAHLRKFGKNIRPGRKLGFGAPIARMGRSAKRQLPLHLHYEILRGNYHTPRKSFGLEPINPFRLLGVAGQRAAPRRSNKTRRRRHRASN